MRGILLIITTLISSCLCVNNGVVRLEELGLSSKIFTVSGFSAGGSIASQLYLSYSNLVRGIALFSGLLYHCGDGPEAEIQKLLQCTRGSTNITRTTRKIQELSNLGLLDPLQNLAYRRHYVEQGQLDVIVRPRAARVLEQFFSQFSPNVRIVELPHTHIAPVEICGSRCQRRLVPGLPNTCGYSAAFDGLSYIYNGRLIHPEKNRRRRCSSINPAVSGLLEFNQREFIPSGSPSVGMATTGFVYVPESCRSSAAHCRLHVHFHGCMGDLMMQGRQYIQNSEFMAIADANNMIILFPQAAFVPNSVSGFLQCWDMIGFTEKDGDGYYWGTKRGRQLGVIYKMMERLLGEEINRIEYSIENNGASWAQY